MTAINITDTSPASIHAAVRKEIQRIMRASETNLRDAIHLYRRSLAIIMADDIMDGREQWAPRLEKYRYATRLEDAVFSDQAGYADLNQLAASI